MAKYTLKQLETVKEYFDKGLFIECEGVIYKKCKERYNFTEENIQYKIAVKKIMNYIKDGTWRYKKEKDIAKIKEIIIDQFNKKLIILKNDWLYRRYETTHQRGYKNFWITIDGVEYRTFAHRIIYYLYKGIWDENRVINHLDGVKDNNKIENLELISQFENILHSIITLEMPVHPQDLDGYYKKKFNLTDEQSEIFNEIVRATYESTEKVEFKKKLEEKSLRYINFKVLII